MIGILILTVIAFGLAMLLLLVETLIGNSNVTEKKFANLLPNYNCGVCGYNTCQGMSKAMMEDPYNYKKCKPLKGEKLEELEAYLRKNKLI